MAGGRHIQPLFDLIGNKGSTAPRPGSSPRPAGPQGTTGSSGGSSAGSPPGIPSKPVIRIELKPGGVADSHANPNAPSGITPATVPLSSPSPDEQPSTPQYWYSPLTGGGTVRLPVALLYVMLCVFVVVVIFAWIAGANVGRSNAERETNKLIRNDLERPVDPLNQPAVDPTQAVAPSPVATPSTVPTTPIDIRKPAPQATTPPQPQTQPVHQPEPSKLTGTPPPGATITSKGYLTGDPRESGKNYLALANLGLEDAKAAVEFLAANGVEAIAVPTVDRSKQPANNPNPSAYRIYALPGVTSEQYSRKMTIRTNLEAKVAQIGKLWQDKHRGASNFARTNWEKFQ